MTIREEYIQKGYITPVSYTQRVANLHDRGFHFAAVALAEDMAANNIEQER